jgi:membrane protease YdiL (CAAX protease family)
VPRPYPQLLRGPNHAWWRSLVSLAVVLGAFLVLLLGFWVTMAAVWAIRGGGPPTEAEYDAWAASPAGVLLVNLLLAGLIPVAHLGVWAGHGWRPRWLGSVLGGVRWIWLTRCAVISLVVMVIANGIVLILAGGAELRPEQRAGSYAVVVLATTPLQAAGEEYFFRGWLSQTIGALVPRAGAGALLAAVVSATAFAYAHGQQDPWLFADRLLFGLVSSWLVWRTGGLEASITLHAAFNLVAFAYSVLTGQVGAMLTVSEADPLSVVIDTVILLVGAAAIDLTARRLRIVRLFRPPLRSWS